MANGLLDAVAGEINCCSDVLGGEVHCKLLAGDKRRLLMLGPGYAGGSIGTDGGKQGVACLVSGEQNSKTC